MADQIKIDSVATYSNWVIPPPLGKVLEKFQGRQTSRTLAAARRIRAKKRHVKMPRNLLRQLFRLTGGFDPSKITGSWGQLQPNANWRRLQIGTLVVGIGPNQRNDYPQARPAVFFMRGIRLAHLPADDWSGAWLDHKRLKEAVEALSTTWE